MQLEMVELGTRGGIAFGVSEPSQTRRSERDDSVDLDALSERYGKIEGAWRLVGTEVETSSSFASNDAGSS
jgi:hypothetical protein